MTSPISSNLDSYLKLMELNKKSLDEAFGKDERIQVLYDGFLFMLESYRGAKEMHDTLLQGLELVQQTQGIDLASSSPEATDE